MQNQPLPLKVGGRVYSKRLQRYGTDIYYAFATVARVTKTQAVLSNGKKVMNEPKQYWGDERYSFAEYGDKYKRWYIETPEAIENARVENRRQSVNQWFDTKKFTQEEKEIVYNVLTAFENANKKETV